MATYQVGETVICSITVTNADTGALTNPTTSMTIRIETISGVVIVPTIAMTNDSVGKFHYDYASGGASKDKYAIIYTATEGSRVTIQRDFFTLD